MNQALYAHMNNKRKMKKKVFIYLIYTCDHIMIVREKDVSRLDYSMIKAADQSG
jgi:hypothetical protein